MKMEELKFLDKKIINSILQKTDKSKRIKDLKIISFPRLYKYLDKTEIELIRKFLRLDPLKYGFKGKFLGMKRVPKNLVTIREQYLPKPVYLAFRRMNKALEDKTGKKLLINSGCRSPAYQAIIFLRYLKLHKFNFLRTVQRVAFPGYSEHGDSKRQAVDFIAAKSVPSDEKVSGFEKTKEFKWLLKNANKFGFYLSYPKNNGYGVIYEPWHWRYH